MDGGNLLFKNSDSAEDPAAHITAHGIARVYSKISYDAVAVSPQDLSAGPEFFKSTQALGLPWISANIFSDDGRLIFPPAVVKKGSGAGDVTIIGLTGKSVDSFSWARIGDWRDALTRQLSDLKTNCGLVILLSNLSDDENLEIARDYSQIHIIIASSPTRKGNLHPQIVGDSLLTQSDSRGKYLGKLELNWHLRGAWLTNSPVETQERLQEKLAAIDEQIKNYKEAHSGANRENDNKMRKMLNYRKSIEDRLTSFENILVEHNQNPDLFNTFDSTFLPVKPRPAGEEVDAIVREITKSIAAYQKTRLKDDGQNRRMSEMLQLAKYKGTGTCLSCHEKQSAFWATTAHAGAFASLERNGQSYNTECLPCHFTGGNITPVSSYTMKDMLLFLPEDRQAVGCETCHGPGRQHTLSPEAVKPVRTPAEQICISCHTPERDDNFTYSSKIQKVACPSDS